MYVSEMVLVDLFLYIIYGTLKIVFFSIIL